MDFAAKKDSGKKIVQSIKYLPDDADAYFMTYLLHDAYETGIPMSTSELAEHHDKYAPLELELKLINLEKHGYIQRVNNKKEGLGSWNLLPKGVEFMFENNHQLQDLLDEQKYNA